MLKLKMQPKNKCLFWHRWALKKDTGVYRYHECEKCKARIVKQYRDSVYQPINEEWVIGIVDNL